MHRGKRCSRRICCDGNENSVSSLFENGEGSVDNGNVSVPRDSLREKRSEASILM